MSEDKKDQDEKAPEFSVHDRRRVHLGDESSSDTEASRTKPEEQASPGTEDAGPSAAQMKDAEDMAEAAAKGHRAAPEVDFNTFVISLASSAFVHLGMAPHPEGGEPQINLPMAKQVVDMLSMLEVKTRGNLDPEEQRYLEAILFELRLRFVEASKAQAK